MQLSEPYSLVRVLTPSDTVALPIINGQSCAALYIGSGGGASGNLVAVWPDTTTTTFTALPTGTILPISPVRINATSTTASLICGLWRF